MDESMVVTAPSGKRADGALGPWKGPGALRNYLVTYNHRALRDAIVRAWNWVQLIMATSTVLPPGTRRVFVIVDALRAELDHHLFHEEREALPGRGGDPLDGPAEGVLERMKTQHGLLTEVTDRVEALTAALEIPAEVRTEWTGLLGALATLREKLAEHIELQQELLFPALERGEAAAR